MNAVDGLCADGVLLCAGRGSRLGGICKGRILVDGEPLVLRQLRVMHQAGLRRAVVVMGFEAEQVAEILQQAAGLLAGIEIVPARLSQAEISDDIQVSVACGLRAVSRSPNRGLFMTLVDLPLLRASHYQAVFSHAQACGADIAMPQNGAGVPGHPLFIGARALAAMPLESPAFRLRDAMRDGALQLRPMATEDPAHFTDLDTAKDAQALMAQHRLKIVIPLR